MKNYKAWIVVLCLLAPTAIAHAAGGGESLFKSKCGACHVKGGEAPPVNPGEKAGTVWEKYFKRGRHPVDLKMSDSEVGVVLQYLVDHAADSDRPEMLAIPK